MVMPKSKIRVIGGGLAGTEAAWQIARHGLDVDLYEMRPVRKTPAHVTDNLAELVCSNSLKSNDLLHAPGLIKGRNADPAIRLSFDAADRSAVPAGMSLSVDREVFARNIQETLENFRMCELMREEITSIPEDGINIIATGPLTSESLAESIRQFTSIPLSILLRCDFADCGCGFNRSFHCFCCIAIWKRAMMII